MFKKVKESTESTVNTATSIKEVFDSMVTSDLESKAEIVLGDFVRKDTERQTAIAELKNRIKAVESNITSLEDKLSKAQKVSNQAALKRDIAIAKADIDVLNAKIVNIETLRSAAATKRDSFIVAFDANPFDALANTDLVREGLDIGEVRFNKDTIAIIEA